MCEQSHASVDQLLTALWHAEYHGRYNLYRTAITLLADVGLEFGMTKWCKRVLDEVMPQVRPFCALQCCYALDAFLTKEPHHSRFLKIGQFDR